VLPELRLTDHLPYPVLRRRKRKRKRKKKKKKKRDQSEHIHMTYYIYNIIYKKGEILTLSEELSKGIL
jgi:hypothetical protein|tara:strand:- start:289 stop:492 length:204 start_codon:yes stop_codon:yes gene_type:complete